MERFKIEYGFEEGDPYYYSSEEYVNLMIRLPYKCFGKIKYKYVRVYRITFNSLDKLNLKNCNDTLEYIISCFIVEREVERFQRNLRRNLKRK